MPGSHANVVLFFPAASFGRRLGGGSGGGGGHDGKP
jgi:hypothetical protein